MRAFLPEKGKWKGIAHHFVASWAGMKIIHGTCSGGHAAGMSWVCGCLVQIDHGIKVTWLPDPIVDMLPVREVCGIRMIVRRALVAENGGANHQQAARVNAFDHLLVGRDEPGYQHIVLLFRDGSVA